ncbi:MAG: hypothetical protein JO327_04800 [Nitrososphaeraceae archaeon]|nr:hypothetical protein [Nitrososphaeraceae archaeon]
MQEDKMKHINDNNTFRVLTSLKTTIPLVFRMVFSNRLYIASFMQPWISFFEATSI